MTVTHSSCSENQELQELTLDDFKGCGWQAALQDAVKDDYQSMFQALSNASQKATDEGRESQGKALQLLAFACSMHFSSNSRKEPFIPCRVLFQGQPINIPDDFTKAQVSFFAQIVESKDCFLPKLNARLAELVWLLSKNRQVEFVLAAIDSYRSVSVSADTGRSDVPDCLERAIVLSKQIGSGAGDDRLAKMEIDIVGWIDSATKQDGFFACSLANILTAHGMGKDDMIKIADKVGTLGREFQAEGEFEKAGIYFCISADWFKANGEKFTEMKILQAEMLVQEASSAVAKANPCYKVATGKYEEAIQVYRKIPRSQRGKDGIEALIVELQAKCQESSKRALEAMTTVRSPSIDISEIVESACNTVKNKSQMEALLAFADICTIDVKQIRDCVDEDFSSPRLQDFIPLFLLHHEGRVIGKVPPRDGHVLSDDKEIRRFWRMVQQYIFEVQLSTHLIVPALHALSLEHRYREADFIKLARQSPLVPIGRETLFGKALFLGYDLDFATAIHLLAPQIEHMVRYALNAACVPTTTVDSVGMTTEKGLSALIDHPKTKILFGENLTFEIKALFCSPFGPNLRNEIAHGLKSSIKCQTTDVIYAWWLGLKLACNSFYWAWNVMQRSEVERKHAESAENEGTAD